MLMNFKSTMPMKLVLRKKRDWNIIRKMLTKIQGSQLVGYIKSVLVYFSNMNDWNEMKLIMWVDVIVIEILFRAY